MILFPTEGEYISVLFASHDMMLNGDKHVLEISSSNLLHIGDTIGHISTFVVCLDKEPIYSGVFWPAHFSSIYPGVSILNIYGFSSLNADNTPYGFTLTYFQYPNGNETSDPRENSLLLARLKADGKLK